MNIAPVEILVGQAAHEALSDTRFLAAWQTLHGKCPHATGFQSNRFVSTWYDTYRLQWQPVLVRSAGLDESLVGLWPLAHDPVEHRLAQAGTHQAEYHAWLALPEAESEFLASALDALHRRFRLPAIRLKYLPDTGLVDKLRAVPEMENRLAVRICSRPLARLAPDEVEATPAKKSKKSRQTRFNRLKRLGDVSFRRLSQPAELEATFDELMAWYDFRQGAVNNETPFHEDPLKHRFHRRLFAVAPDETHVTVTFLDGRPIAGLWGTESGDVLHIGMLIHSPFLAEHSPGKLHMMQLGDLLLAEGKHTLDLTPGGDPWKERFANAHDEVADVTVYRTRWGKRRAELLDQPRKWAKRCLSSLGLSPSDARSALTKLRQTGPAALLRKMGNWASEYREFRVYRCDRVLASGFARDERAAVNSFSAMLAFEPAESWQTRQAFLSNALSRIESGESAYTISIDNRLAHSGWLVRNQTESHVTEVQQKMTLPPGSVVLYDFYTHPDFRGRGLYRAMIKHMLCEAFSDPTAQHAYISVLAENLPSRHVIESIGFQYQGSLHRARRLGAERKWADPIFARQEASGA